MFFGGKRDMTCSMSSVGNSPDQLTCRYLRHPQVNMIWMLAVFTCPVRWSFLRYKHAQIILEMQRFTISTKLSEHAFPHSHLETGESGEQNLIRDDLKLYLFLRHMKIDKVRKLQQLGLNSQVCFNWSCFFGIKGQGRQGENVLLWCSANMVSIDYVDMWNYMECHSALFLSVFCHILSVGGFLHISHNVSVPMQIPLHFHRTLSLGFLTCML